MFNRLKQKMFNQEKQPSIDTTVSQALSPEEALMASKLKEALMASCPDYTAIWGSILGEDKAKITQEVEELAASGVLDSQGTIIEFTSKYYEPEDKPNGNWDRHASFELCAMGWGRSRTGNKPWNEICGKATPYIQAVVNSGHDVFDRWRKTEVACDAAYEADDDDAKSEWDLMRYELVEEIEEIETKIAGAALVAVLGKSHSDLGAWGRKADYCYGR